MKRLAAWIAAHPVRAYFVLAFMFAWPLFILMFAVFPNSMAVQASLGTLAVYAPAIASMVVAGAEDPIRVSISRSRQCIAFLTTWALAWVTLALFASRVRGAPLRVSLALFSACPALLPAFIVAKAFSRVRGIQTHFRSLIFARGNIGWYLFALLAFPAVQVAGTLLTRTFGADASTRSDLTIAVAPDTAVLLFLQGFFFAGGINEESGWRGFALPRLQRRYPPLIAALIVWVFWALWHLPFDLNSGDTLASIVINRALFNLMWSVLFMWVFNRTKASLLAPALFHPAMNTSGTMLPRTDAATALFAVVVGCAIVSDRMWLKLPSTHPAVAMKRDRTA